VEVAALAVEALEDVGVGVAVAVRGFKPASKQQTSQCSDYQLE
jgi:hypothetical protein